MKKFLIPLLVFCMASSAYAVQLSLTADEQTPTAYISGLLDQDIYVVIASDEEITVELGPDAPDLSGPLQGGPGIPELPPIPPYEVWMLVSSTITVYPIVDGTYLIVNGEVGDQVYALWFDEATFTPFEIGGIQLVPEPMTFALLTLGGLFMLRRRKNKYAS